MYKYGKVTSIPFNYENIDELINDIDESKLEKYKIENGSILNFPNTKNIPSSNDILTYKCDILIPAALENTITMKVLTKKE